MKKIFYLCVALFGIMLTGTRAEAQTISSHSETMDSVCGVTSFHVSTAGCATGQTLTAFFGDGTSNTGIGLPCSGTSAFLMFGHAYPASGTYTVKMILYNGSTAVDSVIFSITVSYCRQLPIFAFLDVNGNCTQEITEPDVHSAMSIEVDSAGTVIDTVSMMSGMWYTSYGPAGTIYGFRLLTAPPGMALVCPSTGILHSTVPAAFMAAMPEYFGFQCSSSTSFDLAVAASFRPALAGGGANRANITVCNSSCTGTAATLKFEYSPKYTFGSLYPSTFSYTVSGTSVTVDMGTVTSTVPKNITVTLTPVTTLTLGDTINTKYTVTPISGDAIPSNNVVTRCDTVRSSYDPNQKSVTPSGSITTGTRLEYMLEFENDGNDTAYNIHIMDTLSNSLDINTLQMGVTTHKAHLVKYVNAGVNILKFDFPNIFLPDSSHHDYCRGAVTFSINAKTSLAAGTTIPNRVGIYFDINPVVMTNSVFSKIPLPSGPTGVKNMSLSKVELYPNPVTDVLNIKTDGAFGSLTIYNVVGQVVGSQDVHSTDMKVDVRSLNPGIYYMTLKGTAGTKTIKFEKQ